MKIREIAAVIEQFAPLHLQESYDNAGMQVGNYDQEATGCIVCLDVTLDVVTEAIESGANLIVTHHPLLFHPVKRIVGNTQVEKVIMKALQNDISIYSAHTNLDSCLGGVSHLFGNRLGLTNQTVLNTDQPDSVGATGLGVIGELPVPMEPTDFLLLVKKELNAKVLRYSRIIDRPIKKVALCGGSGFSLYPKAKELQADVYLTAEIPYHSFLESDKSIFMVDCGHFESEQFTNNLLVEIITNNFPNFAARMTKTDNNPVNYLT